MAPLAVVDSGDNWDPGRSTVNLLAFCWKYQTVCNTAIWWLTLELWQSSSNCTRRGSFNWFGRITFPFLANRALPPFTHTRHLPSSSTFRRGSPPSLPYRSYWMLLGCCFIGGTFSHLDMVLPLPPIAMLLGCYWMLLGCCWIGGTFSH